MNDATVEADPGAGNSVELAQILGQLTDELRQDTRISNEQILARYPSHADELRDLLPAFRAIAALPNEDGAGEVLSAAGSTWDRQASRVLGDFQILRELGQGGMGTVFEAEQLSMGRCVALKVLPFAALAQQHALQRFRNEVRAAAALQHPNIVAVYSVGEQRGIHYYSMQLVRGQTLAHVIQQLRQERADRAVVSSNGRATDRAADIESQPLLGQSSIQNGVGDVMAPPTSPIGQAHLRTVVDSHCGTERFRRAASLGIEAAEALQHAHDQGVLHRDIKPSNLMLDADGKLYVTDFGLARIQADTGMTMTGDVVGTLRYMAPEQALAKRVVIDHRADIYSLGATLYELLALQPAFGEADRSELLKQIAFQEPTPLRKLDRRIPAELETIILKAMAKNPEERYADAQLLVTDLRAFLEHRPIAAKRPSLVMRAGKLARRHRLATTVAAIGAVMLLISFAAFAADRWRQVREGTRAVEQSLAAARQALDDHDISQALQRLAEGQARVDGSRLRNADMVDELNSLHHETERYAKFAKLRDEARNDRVASGGSPSVEKAISLYEVMKDDDWLVRVRKSGVPESFVRRITDGMYEVLLLQADRLTRVNSGWPWEGRTSRLKRQGKMAMDFLDKAMTFHAPSKGYYWLKANCLQILDDPLSAARLRQTASQAPLHHADELFYINLDREWGTVSKNRGYPELRFADSYRDHRMMLQHDPTYYNGLFFMAHRLSNAGRHSEALPAWYACVALRPQDLVALYNRAESHANLGLYDEAIGDLEQCMRAKPRGAKVSVLVSASLARLLASCPVDKYRNGDRAEKLARQACEWSEYKNYLAVAALGAALAEKGEFESAAAWTEKALQLGPIGEDRNFVTKLLESCRAKEPFRSVPGDIDAIEAVSDLNLHDLFRADELNELGRHDEAARLDPGRYGVAQNLGDEYAMKAQYREAAEQYLLAVEASPDDYGFMVRAAFLLLASEDRARYEAMCRQMLERLGPMPDSVSAHRTVWACALSPIPVGDIAELVKLADLAVQDIAEPWLLSRERGLVAYRAGDWEGAIKWSTMRGSELDTRGNEALSDATNTCIESMALFQLGRRKDATTLFTNVVRMSEVRWSQSKNWFEWLAYQRLRREAEELLQVSE